MEIYDLNILPSLLKGKNSVLLSEVPKPFRPDLIRFITGETLMPGENGEIIVGDNLYRQWLSKLFIKGFDSEVDLKFVED